MKKHIRFRHPDVSDLSLESIVSSDAASDIASSSSLSDDDCSEESFIVLTTSDSKSSSSPSSLSDLREEPYVSYAQTQAQDDDLNCYVSCTDWFHYDSVHTSLS